MALQSQMRRGTIGARSSDSYNKTRRSEQKRLVGYLLLTLLICGMVLYAWQSRPKHAAAAEPIAETAATPPSAADSGTSAITQKDASSAPAPKAVGQTPTPTSPTPPATSPLVMEMGSKRGNGGGATLIPTNAGKPQTAAPSSSPESTQPPIGATTRNTSTDPDPSTTTSPMPAVKDPLIAPVNSNPAPPPGMAPAGTTESSPVLAEADRLTAQQKPVEARTLLNRALIDPGTSESTRVALRARLQDLNQTLVFSPAMFAGDSMTETYLVASGDSLVKIARKQQLATESALIARVNHMANANSLRVGQQLKLVHGPFHAVVHKNSFRMDIFAGPTPNAAALASSSESGSAAGLAENAEAGWVYIRSFSVGLGEKGSTPLATFLVKDNSKLVNPFWTNPRTGEKFDADDPKNPIGERWVGLEGLDVKSKGFQGYGIHGTIDPTSIGREASMGCVRMGSEDVEIVYELLMPRVSVVKIVP